MNTLQRLNNAFSPKLLDDLFFSPWETKTPVSWPAMNAVEYDDKYAVELELPGVSENDIDISYENGLLTVSGQSGYQNEEQRGNYYIRERRSGSFKRAIRLNRDVEAEDINADFSNGVLRVTIPKSDRSRVKKIPIKTLKALE